MDGEEKQKAYSFLLDLSAKQGYITFEDIISSADKWNLSISSVDWLSSEIITRGILVYEEVPSALSNSIDDEYNDYAQSDYEKIFSEAIKNDPSIEPIIIKIKDIVPPQYNEISTLKYQIKEGNSYARKRMIEMHLRLAVKIALQRTEAFDVELSDAFGWACIGLIYAVDHYDPDINGAFSSYASLWMMQNISREQPTQNPQVYFPAHKKEEYYLLYPELKKHGCIICDKISKCDKLNAHIKKKYDYTQDQIEKILLAVLRPYSLEMLLENVDAHFDDIMEFKKAICDDKEFDNIIERYGLKEIVKSVLSSLNERERNIIIARYGLNDNEEKTLAEVGVIYNLTRERIRQIEAKALKKLQLPQNSKKMVDYY